MRKQIALGVALAFGFLVTAAGGCGKVTDDGAADDAGSDAENSDAHLEPFGDATCCSGPLWQPTCFDPSGILVFELTPLPPIANQGKCASDDLIAQFLASCVSRAVDAGADVDGSVDAGQACDAFVAANYDCALCLGAGSLVDAGTTATPWPALIPIDTKGDWVPAVAACVAAISPATDTCRYEYVDNDLCLQTGCSACTVIDFSACATAESTDPASTCLIAYPLDHDCEAALNTVSQGDADSKCGASTQILNDSDFNNVFTLVAKTMCE